MRKHLIAGWTFILLVCVIPVILWALLGPGEEFFDYASVTHSLGELTGLVGMTMFAVTFLLSTRLRMIEDIFGGLDKVYIAHGILGSGALLMILLHPLLLVVKFIPDNIRQAALYLLPGAYWSVNFGIIALLGLVLLVSITLFTKIKYQKWKFTHTFLGLVFMFAVLHIFMVPADATKDFVFHGYYAFAAVVSAIGISGFAYSLFIKTRWSKTAMYVTHSINRRGDTYEIVLRSDHKPLSYKAGQFVFVRFYNARLSKEPHPFSIASKTDDPLLRIVIKSLGDFTSTLSNLRIGDRVAVEGPYGRFNTHSGKDEVWIAGGIGIVPFLGMSKEIKAKTDLYYSAREESDLVFLEELRASAGRLFRVFPWVSNLRGHLTVETIAKTSGKLADKEYYLCGPEGMKKSIIGALLSAGVPPDSIHDERFEFR